MANNLVVEGEDGEFSFRCAECGDHPIDVDVDGYCEVCARELADEAAVDRAIDLSRDDDFDRCGE